MKVTENSITLDNGTAWANPLCNMDGWTDEQKLRHYERVWGAYHHLLTHPIGTEATVKTLRQLRRAAKVKP